MKIYSFSACPYKVLATSIDRAHIRLLPGTYYIRVAFARFMKKHGILALVYVEEMSTGVIYSIGLSGRPDDSAAYKAVCAAPENSLFWAEVTNTKNGYPRFAQLELVLASDEPPSPVSRAKFPWELASRGRSGLSLRIPYLIQAGQLRHFRIAVVWLSPDIECYSADFSDAPAEFPDLLKDVGKRREFMRTVPRRKDRMQAFVDFMQGSPVDALDLEGANASPQPSVGIGSGDLAPYIVYHLFLSPVLAAGGIKHRRKCKSSLDTDCDLFRLLFRMYHPNLVVAVGSEVARRMPRILRSIPFRGPYRLPELGQIPAGRMAEPDFVRQEFESKWSAEFIIAPDLMYFGRNKIGGRNLPPDFWPRFQIFLKQAIMRIAPSAPASSYSKDSTDPSVVIGEGTD